MNRRAISCRGCGQTFEGDYRRTKCDECKALVRARAMAKFKADNPHYWKEWWERSPKRSRRAAHLLREYGLPEVEYDAMHKGQRGRCAICRRQEGGWRGNAGRLVVDHCHRTGKVRGLLCPYCNRALGQFFDDTEILAQAIVYLSKS